LEEELSEERGRSVKGDGSTQSDVTSESFDFVLGMVLVEMGGDLFQCEALFGLALVAI
jgi:hypothetical protein